MQWGKCPRWLAAVGPGLLVAATGVGAGDLATGALAGAELGLVLLWAVLVGAALKFLVTEGLCRWQLVTGRTLLEGCGLHLGRPAQWLFLLYLLVWSYLVAGALMGAAGAVGHAILPLTGDAVLNKRIYGLLHSGAAVVLVHLGGFRLFERVMNVCIALMFAVTVTTAIALRPDWTEVLSGLLIPRIPRSGAALLWAVALWGGIGGTVTLLCYGYWIQEEGREGAEHLPACRLDLATGYVMTALFGVAMVIIGSTVQVEPGGSVTVIAGVAERLQGTLGRGFKWAFLCGGWAAVFSSLLGVWQSVPYLFADVWSRMRDGPHAAGKVDTRGRHYRGYLLFLATVPAIGLWHSFRELQLTYAVVGACFVPLLAVVLLALNGRRELGRYRNSWWTTCLLVASLVVFLLAGLLEIREKL